MAHALGKHLHEILGWPPVLTHRQFLAWKIWLMEEWNHPDRTDNYLMQIGCEVRRVLAKKPGSHKLEHLHIPFEFRRGAKPAQTAQTPEQRAKASEQIWLAAVRAKKPPKPDK